MGGFNAGIGLDFSYKITEDLSAKQYFLVKQGASLGACLLGDTAGGVVLGVLQDTGLNGATNAEHGNVRMFGETLIKLGGTVSAGDPLQDGGSGSATTATTADYVIGRALEAGVSGDLIRAFINHEGTF